MASIGQLVRALAAVQGLDEGAVKLVARYVREAGFIGQQSTGAGAARMTAADATALLIAVNATALAKDAAEAVSIYSSLSVKDVVVPTEKDTAYLNSVLNNSPTLGAAIEGLIFGYSGSAPLDNEAPIDGTLISIMFERPRRQAAITVEWPPAYPNEGREIHAVIEYAEENPKSRKLYDKRDSTDLSNITLRALGQALNF